MIQAKAFGAPLGFIIVDGEVSAAFAREVPCFALVLKLAPRSHDKRLKLPHRQHLATILMQTRAAPPSAIETSGENKELGLDD